MLYINIISKHGAFATPNCVHNACAEVEYPSGYRTFGRRLRDILVAEVKNARVHRFLLFLW